MNEAVEWMPAGNVRPFPGRSIEFTKRSTDDAFRGMFSAGVYLDQHSGEHVPVSEVLQWRYV